MVRLRCTEQEMPYVAEPTGITCCSILRQQLDQCQNYDFSKIVCDMSPEEFQAVCNLSPFTSLDFFSFLPHAAEDNQSTNGSRTKAERPYLILDLDETLLFTSTTPIPGADAEVIVNVPTDIANPVPLKSAVPEKKGSIEHYSATKDYARSVNSYKLFIKYRPHLEKFLIFSSRYFEIVIFTASRFYYCGAILRQMETDFPSFRFVTPEADTAALSTAAAAAGGADPKRFVTVLHRDHCTPTHAGFVKDLNLLGCNLKRTVLLDNNPICGAFQPYNLVSIRNYELLPDAPEHAVVLSELEKEKGFVNPRDVKTSVAEFLNDTTLKELAQRGSLLYNLAKCDDVRSYCIRTMEYNMKKKKTLSSS
ncbi:NLI interacting factor-like phosphatase domain-containing protein [Strigomonas culicis]|uniref:Mitochondrial import inner membrane translocase subunit TIM50 n=1 Tax=Strigomonas culicis TaxID=28005 RepID=S9U5V6_9TRYP|nr:NLI interacting factor-like phosphatase domain-containing protein [Strigomonas culicis]|eukprot:EPY24353.1 NLI interacting factor-like phosphatase domain-containing protein [Strigomonas culicis]